MTNKPKPKLPCDGCANFIVALDKSIVCHAVGEGGAGLIARVEIPKECRYFKDSKGVRNG